MEETTNNQIDTPEPQGSEQLSVEEAFFQNTENEGNTSIEAPTQDTPTAEGVNIEETQAKNDERRFEYWQSQASLAANENNQLKAQMQQVAQMQQAQQPVAKEPQVEEFPAAPEKPEMPMNFNRGEANEDPASSSAQYVNKLEKWRDDTIQYNALKGEYQTALVAEQLENQQTQRVEEAKRFQAQNQQRQQMNKVYKDVQGQHGLTPEEANEFIQTMSTPDSLTIDNLVQLYRLQKGSGQQVQTQPARPSDTFNQQARAQQVPSPMGVIPAQQNQPTQSSEDSIMDSMISGYKKNNPW
tara:strand:+ start:945 stop:1838 length:894 start_codon:yes stop_codon:yes gene_type:complete